MTKTRLLPLSLGTMWGLFLIVNVSQGSRSDLVGEGAYVLIVVVAPLALIGLVHTSISGRSGQLPLLYASGIALLFAGTLGAYRMVFGADGPDLGTALLTIGVAFAISAAALELSAKLATLFRRD